jgi:hypothetical protein
MKIMMNSNTLIGIVIGTGLAIMLGLGIDKKYAFATKTHKSNIHKGNPANHLHGPAKASTKRQHAQNNEILLTPSQEAAKIKAKQARNRSLTLHGQPSVIIHNPPPGTFSTGSPAFHEEGDQSTKQASDLRFDSLGSGTHVNDLSPIKVNPKTLPQFTIEHGDTNAQTLASDPRFGFRLST